MAFRMKVERGECLRGKGGVALSRIDAERVENPIQNGKQRVNESYEVVARAQSDLPKGNRLLARIPRMDNGLFVP